MKKLMLAANTQPNLDTISYPVLASGKLDGVRGCVQNEQLVSRSLKSSLNRHVTAYLSSPIFEGLDGELTVTDPKYMHDFNTNQSTFMKQDSAPDFVFHVFDDMSKATDIAMQRKGMQLKMRVIELKAKGYKVEYCEQHVANSKEEVLALYDKYTQLGYEGLILAKPGHAYKHGRSTLNQETLLKLKPIEDAEAKIVGFEELMHNLDAGNSNKAENMLGGNMLGAIVVEMPNGKQFKIGTGFDLEMRRIIWENRQSYLGMYASYKFMQLSPYGIPRCPVYKGIRYKGDM